MPASSCMNPATFFMPLVTFLCNIIPATCVQPADLPVESADQGSEARAASRKLRQLQGMEELISREICWDGLSWAPHTPSLYLASDKWGDIV